MTNGVRFECTGAKLPTASTQGFGRFALRRLPLLSVSAAWRGAGEEDKQLDFVVEGVTDTQHPTELCDLAGGACLQLLGVGCRKKRMLPGVPPMNVYSVGMYGDPQQLGGMAEHQGKSASDLEDDSAFLQDMTQPNVTKELRMVITFRHVSSDAFWKALHERLGPLLEKDASATDALPAFKQHFQGVKMKKGCEVKLLLENEGDVTTFIDKSKRGSVRSDALSAALMNVYLGSEPPSPEMKDDFLTSASRLLQTHHTPSLVSDPSGESAAPATDTPPAKSAAPAQPKTP